MLAAMRFAVRRGSLHHLAMWNIVAYRYRQPGLVAAIVSELGLDAIEAGPTADDMYFALWHKGADPCQLLLAALTSGNFATLPKIEVRCVKPRYSESRIESGTLRNVDGVLLFADDRVEDGDRVLMLLQRATIDAKSALRQVLLAEPQTTRQAAHDAVKAICPRLSQRAFDRDWPQARLDVGLTEQAPPGRPKKTRRKTPAAISR